MIYVNMIEDAIGDLIDEEWFCSAQCFELHMGQDSSGHAWPGGTETDYDVHCAECGTLLWRGW